MLIILGFAVALLLALILGKLLWGQAIGLGKRRSRRDDPATIVALQADKDKLRAEAAMLSRKLELRLNDLKTRLAEQSAEVSRNRNRVDHLVGEIKDREKTISKRDIEIEDLKSQMIPLERELVARTQTAQQLKEQMREQDETLVHKTELVDNLHEQLKGAMSANSIVGEIDMSADDRLRNKISDLNTLSKQIEDQRIELTQQHSELKTLTGVITKSKSAKKNKTTDAESTTSNKDAYIEQLDSGSSKLEKQLEEAERETDKLQEELSQLDEDWNEKLKQLDAVKLDKTKKPTTKGAKQTRSNKKAKKKSSKTPAKNDPPQEQENTGEGVSNVVSLASRIRSLQSDIKGQKK